MRGPTTWEVWTELVVPLLGALGSIAVAAVAVVVTVRLARAEQHARALERAADARRERAELLPSMERCIASDGSDADLDELRNVAARIPGAQSVIDWIASEVASFRVLRRRNELARIAWPEWHHANMIRERVRRWVEVGGEFDASSLDADRERVERETFG